MVCVGESEVVKRERESGEREREILVGVGGRNVQMKENARSFTP